MSKRLTYGGKPTKHALHIEACKNALDWDWLMTTVAKVHDAHYNLSDGSLRDMEHNMGQLFRATEELWETLLDIAMYEEVNQS